MSLSRWLVAGLPIVGFIGLALVLMSGIGKDPSILPSMLIGKQAPEFELPLLYEPEQIVSKQDLLGQQYFINVWGSWCPTCQYEHPFIEQMSNEMNLTVVGLNWKDTRDEATRWLKQFGNPYETILFDDIGTTGIDFGVAAAPETFLISADGTVLAKYAGQLTPEVFDTTFADMLTP